MKRVILVLVVLSLQGCASLVRIELPDEFKDKKVKEDPPVGLFGCKEGETA